MADGQIKKDDRTQVVDLSLGNSSGQGLRLAQGAGLASGAPSFDLGASASPRATNPAQTGPQFDLAGGSFNGQSGHGSAFGDTNQNNPTIGYQNVFTEDVKLVQTKRPSALLQVLAAVILVVGGLLGYTWYITGDASNIFVVLGLSGDDDFSQSDEFAKTPDLATSNTQGSALSPNVTEQNHASGIAPDGANRQTSSAMKTSVAEPGDADPSQTQVWTRIENEMGGDLPPRGKSLSTDEESSFKAALSHEFNYQRYKTVLDLAAAKAPGSEELLRSVLDSDKLWMRMRALIALADMGDQITDEDVRQGLGKTHSELRARFFKRFEKSPCSVGCFYVARAALKHLDGYGRAQVLRVIAREPSDVRDVFMVAATFDGNESVRQTAQDWLSTQNIDSSIWQEVKTKYGVSH